MWWVCVRVVSRLMNEIEIDRWISIICFAALSLLLLLLLLGSIEKWTQITLLVRGCCDDHDDGVRCDVMMIEYDMMITMVEYDMMIMMIVMVEYDVMIMMVEYDMMIMMIEYDHDGRV